MITVVFVFLVYSFSELKFCLTRGNILCWEETANFRLSTEKYVHRTYTMPSFLQLEWMSSVYPPPRIHKSASHHTVAPFWSRKNEKYWIETLPELYVAVVVPDVTGCISAACSRWIWPILWPSAQEDHPDTRFPQQKEPPPEDQTSGAEKAGAGGLHPGMMTWH